ncbi:unnamed protein product [Arctia plantaginis]|uniref:Autophagy-related protein 2 n=1 Tax=Arctia plantaginis TaxID=874455 RepID=A0A8S0ZD56_ARCPL|nr:unnamed protein product [Arctia plantaginis]
MIWCLPWFTPHCEIIKLKSIRSLIGYYLGNFLEKITLDQLSVNLYTGTGIVCDVTLKSDELNKLGDKQNWPLIIKKGRIEDISVKVPWTKNSENDSLLMVNGLSLTVQPKIREEPVISVLSWISSIWSNWAKWSSCKVCLNRKKQLDLLTDLQIGQMDFISDAIYSKLQRINVKFVNTKIIVEHMPKDIDQSVVLVIFIKSCDLYENNVSDQISDEVNSKKRIIVDGISLANVELPKQNSGYHDLGMKDSHGSQKPKSHKRNKKRSIIPESFGDEIDTDMHAIESETGNATGDANGNNELTPNTETKLLASTESKEFKQQRHWKGSFDVQEAILSGFDKLKGSEEVND